MLTRLKIYPRHFRLVLHLITRSSTSHRYRTPTQSGSRCFKRPHARNRHPPRFSTRSRNPLLCFRARGSEDRTSVGTVQPRSNAGIWFNSPSTRKVTSRPRSGVAVGVFARSLAPPQTARRRPETICVTGTLLRPPRTCRSCKQNTHLVTPGQIPPAQPIIGLPALLRLVEWYKEAPAEHSARRFLMRQSQAAVVPPAPRSKIVRQLNPRRIWMTLAVEQREQILRAR